MYFTPTSLPVWRNQISSNRSFEKIYSKTDTLTHWDLVTPCGVIEHWPDGTRPLIGPVLTNHQRGMFQGSTLCRMLLGNQWWLGLKSTTPKRKCDHKIFFFNADSSHQSLHLIRHTHTHTHTPHTHVCAHTPTHTHVNWLFYRDTIHK